MTTRNDRRRAFALTPRPYQSADHYRPDTVRAKLRHGDLVLDVRLIGMRSIPGYAWLELGEPAPPALLPVVLGRRGDIVLHVDLTATPDVVTIIGSAPACGRLALAYARGVHAAGAALTEVGEALPSFANLPLRRVDTVAELLDEPDPDTGLVICDSVGGADLTAARQLLTRTGGQVVPILIGRIPSSRWSVLLDE